MGEPILSEPDIKNLLTDREYQIAFLIARDHRPKDIAVMFGKSEKTIYTHLDHIRKKLGRNTILGIARTFWLAGIQ